MPQFDPANVLPQLFWLVIAFGLLYVLMSRVALPRIADVLEQRQDRIAADLDKAQEMRSQAEAVLAEYEAALAKARSEAQAIIGQVAAEAAAAADRRHKALGERLMREANEAAARIDAAKTQALGEVRTIAIDVAGEISRRLLGQAPDPAAVEAAVADSMQRVG